MDDLKSSLNNEMSAGRTFSSAAMHSMSIGERIYSERNRLNIKQNNFSNIAGVTPQTQRKYEKNQRTPDANYLQAIASIGVDVQFVITGTYSSPTEAASKKRFDAQIHRIQAALDSAEFALSEAKRQLSEVTNG